MNNTVAWFKVIALTAFSLLCFSLILLSIRATRTLTRIDNTLQTLNNGVTSLSGSLRQTLESVNQPCGNDHPCGTLADINRTLATIRGTAGQIEVAVRHENRNLTTIDHQETSIYWDGKQALRRVNQVLDSANVTIEGLQPIEKQILQDAQQLEPTITSLSELVSDPNLSKVLSNATSITDSGKSIAADAAYETHKLTHPTKKTGFWVGFWFVVEKLKPALF